MENKIPEYYIGKKYRYEARKIIDDYDLNYNVGTAVSYLLRSDRKHKSPIQDITKAINHLQFELDKINGVI
jgi:hypothetical protein